MSGKSQNTEINDVTFNYNETKILAGDNRGSIQIWDLKSQKSRTFILVESIIFKCAKH